MARQAKGKEKRQLSINLSPKILDRLAQLRDLTDADSLTEVVRRSLAVYDYLWSQKVNGGTTLIQMVDGETKEVVLL